VGERVEEGKDGGEKGWKREKVERKRGRKGGGGKVLRDCAVLKIPLKSPGPRPSLTLRQIDAPVQDLVHAIWALFYVYFQSFCLRKNFKFVTSEYTKIHHFEIKN